MTYRERDFRDPCVECGADAASRCARCGDPICAAHVYSDDGLCRECESEFLRRGSDDGPGSLAGLTVGGAIFTAVGVSLLGGGLLIALLGGIGAGAIASIAHVATGRRRRRYVDEKRRKFLEERPGR